MLNVFDDKLVVDQKGIYSIEKFLVARRLMYWQVYLHKTVISAEQILRKIIKRAKYLISQGEELFAFPDLHFFLLNVDTIENGQFERFAAVDDDDISASIKVWAKHSDTVLSYLCNSLVNRRLFRVKIDNKPFDINVIEDTRQKTSKLLNISYEDTEYLVVSNTLSNNTYQPLDDEISILDKSGKIQSIIDASDMFNHEIMSKTVLKFYFCYPKQLDQLI
jgi:HD superfamily phosphohydrolase